MLGRRAREPLRDQWTFLGDFVEGHFRSGDTLPEVAQQVAMDCAGTPVQLTELFTTWNKLGGTQGSLSDFSTVQQNAGVPLSPRPKPPGVAEYSDFRWATVGEVLELAKQSISATSESRGRLSERVLADRKRLKEQYDDKGVVLGLESGEGDEPAGPGSESEPRSL